MQEKCGFNTRLHTFAREAKYQPTTPAGVWAALPTPRRPHGAFQRYVPDPQCPSAPERSCCRTTALTGRMGEDSRNVAISEEKDKQACVARRNLLFDLLPQNMCAV